MTDNLPEIESGYIPPPITKCEGNFAASDQKNGEGYHTWNKESFQEYTGNFVNDNLHGYGRYIHLNGNKSYMYEGTMYANDFEGYSNITYLNGDYFEGLFRHNRRFGPGVHTYANGTQNVGLWYGTQLIRLSTVVMCEWVPKLAISSVAKTKLLKYRKLVPVRQEYRDVAKDILVKLNASPEVLAASSKLYNPSVRNVNSLFFDKTTYDETFFGQIDYTIDVVNEDDGFIPTMSSLNQCTPTKEEEEESPKDIVKDLLYYLLENVNIVENLSEAERKVFVYESILEARKRFQIKRDGTVNNVIEEILDSFMKELDNLLSEPSLKRTLILNKKCIRNLLPQDNKSKMNINSRKVVVTDLLAWNNDELSIEILKHVFAHRNRENSVSFSIPKLLSGDRGKFNTPGKLERKCIQFLTHCSSGNVNEALKIFKDNKLNPDLCDARGNSGIIFGSARDMWRVITVLCDFGANIDLVNDECLTALAISLLRYIAIEHNIKDWQKAFIPDAVISQEEELQVKNWHPHVSLTNINLLSVMSLVEPHNISQENGFHAENYNNLGTALKTIMSDSSEITHAAMYKELRNIEIGMIFKNFQEPYSQSVDLTQDYIFKVKCLSPTMNTPTKLRKPSPSDATNKNKNPNDEFIKNNKLKVVMKTIRVLLNNGADPNLSIVPLPVLHLAIFCKNASLIQLLLKSNANPNITTQDEGLTPLHIIASLPFSNDNLEMFRILLENGGNPNLRSNTYHWMQEKQKIIGKEKYTEDDLGKTPLHILSMRYDFANNEIIQTNMVNLLLNNGSDVYDSYLGHNALTLAFLRGNTELIKFYLETKNVDPYKSLGGNMGVLSTILTLKRYAEILSAEKTKRVYELLAAKNINPLVDVDEYGNAIEFMEREYISKDSNRKNADGAKKRKTKTSVATIPEYIKPTKEVKLRVGPRKFLIELTKRMLERHIQYQAFKYLRRFIMQNISLQDELMIVLIKFFSVKDFVNLLQLLIHRGILKPKPSNLYIAMIMLQLVSKYDKTKDKKIKNGDSTPAVILKKMDWSEKQHVLGYCSVEPELDTELEKYKVCFYCLKKTNKDLIVCPVCGLVYFCCQECNKLSIKQTTIHKCNVLFYNTQKQNRDYALANNLEYEESNLQNKLHELDEILRKKYGALLPETGDLDFDKVGSFIYDQISENDPDFIKTMNEMLEKEDLVPKKDKESEFDVSSITAKGKLEGRDQVQVSKRKGAKKDLDRKKISDDSKRSPKRKEKIGFEKRSDKSEKQRKSSRGSKSKSDRSKREKRSEGSIKSVKDKSGTSHSKSTKTLYRRDKSMGRYSGGDRSSKQAVYSHDISKSDYTRSMKGKYDLEQIKLRQQYEDKPRFRDFMHGGKFGVSTFDKIRMNIFEKFSRLPHKCQYCIEKLSELFPEIDFSLLFWPYVCYVDGQLYYRFLEERPVFLETFSNV